MASRFVALLRGINVGGRNLVPMSDLRAAFEEAGYGAVRTYIQSGNVLFEATGSGASIERAVDTMLERRFGAPIVAVVRSQRQLHQVVERAPEGFGTKPGTFHSDVIFLKAPLTPRAAMRVVELRDGVDEAWPGTGVVYFARRSDRRTQSKMSRIVGTTEYRSMTIRNWTTVTTLASMIDAQG